MDIHAAEEDNIIKEIIKVSEALSAIETKDYSDNKWIIDLLKVVKDPNLIMPDEVGKLFFIIYKNVNRMVEDEYFDSNYPVLHNEFNSFGYEDKNKMLVFISHLNEHFKPVGNGNPVASASHRSAAQLRVSELFFANHTKKLEYYISDEIRVARQVVEVIDIIHGRKYDVTLQMLKDIFTGYQHLVLREIGLDKFPKGTLGLLKSWSVLEMESIITMLVNDGILDVRLSIKDQPGNRKPSKFYNVCKTNFGKLYAANACFLVSRSKQKPSTPVTREMFEQTLELEIATPPGGFGHAFEDRDVFTYDLLTEHQANEFPALVLVPNISAPPAIEVQPQNTSVVSFNN